MICLFPLVLFTLFVFKFVFFMKAVHKKNLLLLGPRPPSDPHGRFSENKPAPVMGTPPKLLVSPIFSERPSLNRVSSSFRHGWPSQLIAS